MEKSLDNRGHLNSLEMLNFSTREDITQMQTPMTYYWPWVLPLKTKMTQAHAPPIGGQEEQLKVPMHC